MKIFQHRIDADEEAKTRGNEIARRNGLPSTVKELPPNKHSWSHICTFTRTLGYRRVYDSLDTYKLGKTEVNLLRRACARLGIIPVFRGDYITFDSLPRRNIVVEEFTGSSFRNGIKTITKHLYFDVEDYVSLE